MYTIKPFNSVSTNIYVKHTQLKQHVKTLREIWSHQKNYNEIRYDFRVLRDSVKYWNSEITKIEKQIKELEQGSFAFGSPANENI